MFVFLIFFYLFVFIVIVVMMRVLKMKEGGFIGKECLILILEFIEELKL